MSQVQPCKHKLMANKNYKSQKKLKDYTTHFAGRAKIQFSRVTLIFSANPLAPS